MCKEKMAGRKTAEGREKAIGIGVSVIAASCLLTVLGIFAANVAIDTNETTVLGPKSQQPESTLTMAAESTKMTGMVQTTPVASNSSKCYSS